MTSQFPPYHRAWSDSTWYAHRCAQHILHSIQQGLTGSEGDGSPTGSELHCRCVAASVVHPPVHRVRHWVLHRALHGPGGHSHVRRRLHHAANAGICRCARSSRYSGGWWVHLRRIFPRLKGRTGRRRNDISRIYLHAKYSGFWVLIGRSTLFDNADG